MTTRVSLKVIHRLSTGYPQNEVFMTELQLEGGRKKRIGWSNISISDQSKIKLKMIAKKENRSMTNCLAVIINKAASSSGY